jgi:RHS repeat-associated protein
MFMRGGPKLSNSWRLTTANSNGSGNGVSTDFVYDGQDVVKDLNSDGSTVDYLNGLGIDNKIRQTSTVKHKTTLYYTADHLGSTTALTNDKGHIVDEIEYDAFGNSTGSDDTRYDYTGRERDPLTGLLYYRARWYDPKLGRFISEDPIGLAGGMNQFAYAGNNPQNGKDPTGLYEIDVHYYLTYYLALKMGCFSDAEARQIANGDQGVDENPETRPGLGNTQQQRDVNAFYHALHTGSHQPYFDAHWMNATMGRGGNLTGLGIYLHYLQDTFSHQGFTDPVCGHGCLDWHYPDKTDSDFAKTVRMAQETWYALNRFARETNRCGCKEWTDASWKDVYDFAKASGGPDFREISAQELEIKRRILGVLRR